MKKNSIKLNSNKLNFNYKEFKDLLSLYIYINIKMNLNSENDIFYFIKIKVKKNKKMENSCCYLEPPLAADKNKVILEPPTIKQDKNPNYYYDLFGDKFIYCGFFFLLTD